MFSRALPRWLVFPLLVACWAVAVNVGAQQQSLSPGVNKSYEDPDVEKATKRFEGDSREAFHMRDQIVAACQVRPGMDVADIGAGTGLFTRLMAPKVGPKGRVYAVDIARKFVEHVEKACREQRIENVTGVVCTATSAELPPESIDLAFVCDTYHHFEYPYKMLASIRRALRPGGRLVIVDYRKEGKWAEGHVRADKPTVIEEVTRAGFKLLDGPEGFLKEQYMVRFEKAPAEPTKAPAAGGSYADWLRHRDAVRKEPGLLRYYAFEGLRDGAGQIPSLAGTGGSLEYRAPKGSSAGRLRTLVGRRPHQRAAQLDEGWLEGTTVDLSSNGFSVIAWLRIAGPGTHRGNNEATNGTLLALGNGYWEGWRLTTSYPDRTIHFEIGRPKPSHSVGIATAPVSDRQWHHVAATWDGRQMRLYVDGIPAASGEYAGSYTPPAGKRALRIGYANAGIGSVVLEIDEAAIYGRALSAEEVFEQAYPWLVSLPGPASPERLAVGMLVAKSLFAKGDYAAARKELARLVSERDAPTALRGIAQLRIAQSFVRQEDLAAAKAEYRKILDLADVLPHQQWEARRRIGELERIESGLPARDPAASRTQLPKRPEPAVTLYVAPDGSDANPGTRERPFAGLERARDELRRLKQSGGLGAGGAAVLVRGGRYPVRQTFTLAAEDSGTPEAPIVWRACEEQAPVFTGGVRLRGFQTVSDPKILGRVPEEARGKLVQVDLKAHGLTSFKPLVLGGFASGRGFKTHPAVELFFDGQPLPLARWPNQGFVATGDVLGPTPKENRYQRKASVEGVFTYDGDRPARWTEEKDAHLYGYWFYDWADSYERVQSIDTQKRTITLAPPYHRYGYRAGRRYYALNLLAEIDAPGEWYLDRAAGVLYFWPPSDPSRAVVELSTVEVPFVEMADVSHVTLQGLVWESGCGDGIVLRGGQRCLLAGCTVRHFGGNGVEIRGGTGHGLLGCDVYSMGRGGVVLSGGNRKTLAPSGYFVENCHIHHLSRIDHTYTPAVRGEGVGHRIAHNLMHHIGSSALNVRGNDHLVELNEVHNVVLESDDQGGVDLYGDPTFRGNVYRWNYWHHIGAWQPDAEQPACGQAGIRLDDAVSGVLVYGNVFYRCSAGNFGGVQIHGGKDNAVDGNLFVDCRTAVSFTPWGQKRWLEFTAKSLDSPQIDRALYLARYPQLAHLADDPDVNLVCRNLVYRCGEFLRRNRGGARLFDNWVTEEDPGFADAAGGVFRFKGDGGLDRVSLEPIPWDEIGLYRDEIRRGLPERNQ